MNPKHIITTTCIFFLITVFIFAISNEVNAAGTPGEDVQVYATVAEYEQATGNKIAAYAEAPMLADKVKAGELGALSERLPEEPSVIVPWEQVGGYGGTLRTDSSRFRDILHHGLFQRDSAGKGIRADLAKGYEYSDDYTSLTIFLRPGMKWSDGEPFTVNDILFWWEDEYLNEELNPGGKSGSYKVGDAEFVKVDDYTLRIDFAVPMPGFMAERSHPYGMGQSLFFHPKHYLKKWHKSYNADADTLAKDEGYESWIQAYRFHAATWQYEKRAGMPTLNPWMTTEVTSTYMVAERNPYFAQVDTAGNQLPYLDKVYATITKEAQTKILQAIGGEIDYLSGYEEIPITDYPLVMENQEKGDYRVVVNVSSNKSAISVTPNVSVKDPVLYEIFHDLRFRQALSLAIDRESINEAIFFGLCEPRQAAPSPEISFYKDEWGSYMVAYDPDKANQLLDEMGLEWDADHKLRSRPDGKPMNLLIESGHGTVLEATAAEVLRAQWEKVGITLTIRPEKLTPDRLQEGELFELFIIDEGGPMFLEVEYIGGGPYFLLTGYGWNRWLGSDGADGTEPPEEWKQLAEKIDTVKTLVPQSDEWIDLWQQIEDFRVKQLWHIGTVYKAPITDMVSNKLRNYPEGIYFSWLNGMHTLLQSQQWFFAQ